MSHIQSKKIVYRDNSTDLEGILVFDASSKVAVPGLVMAPNWMGVTDASVSLAEKAVAQGYVVLIADLYGQGRRPSSAEEAGEIMMTVKNTPQEVGRMALAIAPLQAKSAATVIVANTVLYGLCLGGDIVPELARSGAALQQAATFLCVLDTCGPLYAL